MKHSPTVRVGTIWKSSKACYYLKWRDPVTGKYRTEKTDITTRNDRAKAQAIKRALAKEAAINAELNRGQWSWDAFERRYREHHLKFTSKDNQYKWDAVANFVAMAAAEDPEIAGKLTLDDIRPMFLTEVETLLRSELSPGSVSSYMGTLRSGLSWAASEEMMPPLARRRRPPGRQAEDLPAYRLIPISAEALHRMKDVAGQVVGRQHGAAMGRYLEALWLSGCRMREPLYIHPFRRDCHRPLKLDGEEPEFFWTTEQKSRRAGRHRITLDFAADVKQHLDRNDFLYRPTCETGEILQRTPLGKAVAEIGRKAEVLAEDGKFATAKHFRTSFVQRWSARGMPVGLIRDICRHSSEATTLRYYVGNSQRPERFDETAYIGDQNGDLS